VSEAALAAVRARLAAGDLDGAADMLRDVTAAEPGNLTVRLLQGELLERRGRHAEAAAHYGDLRAAWPDNPWLAARLATALAAIGEAQAALTLYRDVIASAALPEAMRTQIVRRLAAANRRDAEIAALLESRLDATPDDPALLREVASSAATAGRDAAALGHFARSHALESLPAWACALRLEAMARHRRQTGAYPLADAALIAALEDALERFPSHPLFVRELNRLPLARPDWQRLYALHRRRAPTAPPDGFLGFEMAKARLQAGDREAARALLDGLGAGSTWDARARPLREVFATVPEALWQRSRLCDDEAAEVQVVATPGARRTLMIFATLAGDFMMLPLAGLDALLAEMPAHVVYLRDTVWNSGLGGFRSLGPGIGDAIAALRAWLARLDAPDLVTVGGSVSGLSALRYGARLGAARAVAFGALTTTDPEFSATPPRLQRTGRRALETAPGEQERFREVAAELAASPAMRVDLFIGADCPLDHAQAARLAGLPGIATHAEPGVDHHYVALTMIARGRFLPAIAGAFPAPAAAAEEIADVA